MVYNTLATGLRILQMQRSSAAREEQRNVQDLLDHVQELASRIEGVVFTGKPAPGLEWANEPLKQGRWTLTGVQERLRDELLKEEGHDHTGTR